LVLDFALIPHHGALGAALANGTAQTFSVLALWVTAVRLLKVRISIFPIAKTVLISVAMAIVVHLAASRVPSLLAVIMAVILGPAVYLILLRITCVLSPADHGRMLHLKHYVPSSVGRIFESSLKWLIPIPASGH
jgi:O-antigen/teichoic acid export membrane protein